MAAMRTPAEPASPVIYKCGSCDKREVADTPFEADKPNGFYLDLRKVTGEKYRYHVKTPETVYFCTKECLIDGLKYGISHMTEETTPIGMDPRRVSPWH
jgi:hypothetical protein